MADIIQNQTPGEDKGTGFSAGLIIGIIVVALIILFLMFNWGRGGVGDDVNVDVNPGAGGGAATDNGGAGGGGADLNFEGSADLEGGAAGQ